MSFSVLLITVEGMRPPTPLVAAPETKFEMHDIGMHIVLASKNQREIDYLVKYFMIRPGFFLRKMLGARYGSVRTRFL